MIQIIDVEPRSAAELRPIEEVMSEVLDRYGLMEEPEVVLREAELASS